MKPQTKSTLIVVATLLIGMVLGALVNGMVRTRVHERWNKGSRQDRFGQMMNRVIQPDSTQAMAIKEVMDRYAPRFADQQQRHFTEMRSLFDSAHAELEPILTEEQLDRLKGLQRRMYRGFRGPGQGKRNGPGEPPPPPDGL